VFHRQAQAPQVHLMKIHREDVGHHYSYMVSRLLLAYGWVCLGLRRQHATQKVRAISRCTTAANMRSMLGLGAAARAADALMGQGQPREVRPRVLPLYEPCTAEVLALRSAGAFTHHPSSYLLGRLQVVKELPYVVANPPMGTILRADDCVFVLAHGTPYGSWVQSLM
jgi:hypothetical protein